MITIVISSFNDVPAAVNWCKETIPQDEWWDMRADFSGATTYRFIFEDERYATLFILKWVH